MLCSHLEGFVKDTIRAYLNDLNTHLIDFLKMPDSVKRSFCERIVHFEGIQKPLIEQRIQQLYKYFEKNPIKIDLSAFPNIEKENKNPNAKFLDMKFSQIGIACLTLSLSTTSIDEIFKDDAAKDWLLVRQTKRENATLYKFPYQKSETFGQFQNLKKPKAKYETLWETYLDDVLPRRHKIVHGQTLGNPTDDTQLEKDLLKLRILMHGILLCVASTVAK